MVPVINGGSGADEHPTQALLDIFTIQECFEFQDNDDSAKRNWFDDLREDYPRLQRGLDSKVYGFCGDILRGRTVRSLATLLARYRDVTMHFVSPPDLRMPKDIRQRLLEQGVHVYEHDRLADVVEEVDLLYMTRIQWEHTKGAEGPLEVGADYIVTPTLLRRMKSYAPVLHPFPRNQEIPPEIDDDQRRAKYFDQARNGLWVRAALLAHLFDVDIELMSYHRQHFSRYHDYNQGAI